MSAASPALGDASFNMDAAVTKLMALAANKRHARTLPTPKCDGFEGRIFSVSDLPEQSDAWIAADEALKAFADELAEIGGMELMVEVYDETIERHGYRAASGVSASWSGCHGWWH